MFETSQFFFFISSFEQMNAGGAQPILFAEIRDFLFFFFFFAPDTGK